MTPLRQKAEKFVRGRGLGNDESEIYAMECLIKEVRREVIEECSKRAYQVAFDTYDNDPTAAGIAARIDSEIRALGDQSGEPNEMIKEPKP